MTETSDTALQWVPSPEMWPVIEYLACGYSQNRVSDLTGVAQSTISEWWNVRSFSPQFQAIVMEKARQIVESRETVLEQDIALAQLVFHQGLTGERPKSDPAIPLAVGLLSSTLWKQYTGGHKQFGAS